MAKITYMVTWNLEASFLRIKHYLSSIPFAIMKLDLLSIRQCKLLDFPSIL